MTTAFAWTLSCHWRDCPVLLVYSHIAKSCGTGQAIERTLHRGKVAKKRFCIRMVGVRLGNALVWNASNSCLPSWSIGHKLAAGMLVLTDRPRDRSSVVPILGTRICGMVRSSDDTHWTFAHSPHSGWQMDALVGLLWSRSATGEGHHLRQGRHRCRCCTCRYCAVGWEPFCGMPGAAFEVLIWRTSHKRSSFGSGPKIPGLWPLLCGWVGLHPRSEDDWWT